MAKVILNEYEYEGKIYDRNYQYYCPGCKTLHFISPDRHTFNGNVDAPTFTPSVFKNWEPVCHSFITDGKISYCGDSWHELKNQTVELPHIDKAGNIVDPPVVTS